MEALIIILVVAGIWVSIADVFKPKTWVIYEVRRDEPGQMSGGEEDGGVPDR